MIDFFVKGNWQQGLHEVWQIGISIQMWQVS
jgi:hypothetical protein